MFLGCHYVYFHIRFTKNTLLCYVVFTHKSFDALKLYFSYIAKTHFSTECINLEMYLVQMTVLEKCLSSQMSDHVLTKVVQF